MYSKAGKATLEFFSVLQHPEDILEPKSLKHKTTFTPKSVSSGDKLAEMAAKKFGQKNIMKDLAGVLDSEDGPNRFDSLSKSVRSARELKKIEPFSQTVSRDHREKVLSFKTVSSNAAYYQPKYDYVEKKPLIMVDYTKTASKRMFDDIIFSVNSPNQNQGTLPPLSDKPKEKVKGIIPLDVQVARPDIMKEAMKRKVCVTDELANPQLPSSLSGVPRLPRIRFSKSLSRKEIVTETAALNCPIYDYDHEVVKKSLGHVGPTIDKVSGRKDVIQQPYYTIGGVYDYDAYVKKNNSSVYPKVKIPVFDKMSPRERDPSSPYPGYLQALHSKLDASVALTSNHKSARSIETSMFSSMANPRT